MVCSKLDLHGNQLQVERWSLYVSGPGQLTVAALNQWFDSIMYLLQYHNSGSSALIERWAHVIGVKDPNTPDLSDLCTSRHNPPKVIAGHFTAAPAWIPQARYKVVLCVVQKCFQCKQRQRGDTHICSRRYLQWKWHVSVLDVWPKIWSQRWRLDHYNAQHWLPYAIMIRCLDQLEVRHLRRHHSHWLIASCIVFIRANMYVCIYIYVHICKCVCLVKQTRRANSAGLQWQHMSAHLKHEREHQKQEPQISASYVHLLKTHAQPWMQSSEHVRAWYIHVWLQISSCQPRICIGYFLMYLMLWSPKLQATASTDSAVQEKAALSTGGSDGILWLQSGQALSRSEKQHTQKSHVNCTCHAAFETQKSKTLYVV